MSKEKAVVESDGASYYYVTLPEGFTLSDEAIQQAARFRKEVAVDLWRSLAIAASNQEWLETMEELA